MRSSRSPSACSTHISASRSTIIRRSCRRWTRTPGLVGDLVHWQHDTFIARWRDREMRADAYITFALNPDGTIDQAKMQAVSPDTDFSFDFHHLRLKPKD